MKAYQINDYDWVAVPDDWTREQIIGWHLSETGENAEEADYYPEFEELDSSRVMVTDDTEDGSFVETTVGAVLQGCTDAFLLASTEY